jgi:hypothetical protein
MIDGHRDSLKDLSLHTQNLTDNRWQWLCREGLF